MGDLSRRDATNPLFCGEKIFELSRLNDEHSFKTYSFVAEYMWSNFPICYNSPMGWAVFGDHGEALRKVCVRGTRLIF
jgi:hypothetical protein